jgi:hypothetical protein
MTAGDTLFAVSLAGSLFFSISPTAAKDKVLLYLLLTMGPFAVVAPALGPLIDRSRGARRAMVVASAAGRAVLCPFLARDIHSLLLFPEAFAMLVLSKVYLVTKGALVPEMAALGLLDDITDADADADAEGDRPAPRPTGRVLPSSDPTAPTMPMAAPNPGTPPYGTPVVRIDDPVTGVDKLEPDLATLNARLGLLASLSGFVFAVPAVIILKVGGAPSVLWVSVGVFIAAMVAGVRLPVPNRIAKKLAGKRQAGSVNEPPVVLLTSTPEVVRSPDFDQAWIDDEADLAAYRPMADTEVVLALMPMSVLKALVGFLTFLIAFALRREAAATWWFGFVLGGLTAGALIGVLLVSRIRKVMSEQQILTAALLLVAAFATLGAFFPVRWVQALVAVAMGIAGAVAKPSFDALVQRNVAESNQGRAFARFETRLQLMWVLGSFVPVVLALPLEAGDFVMAVVAAVGAVSYISSRRAVRGELEVMPRGHPTG